MKPMLIVQLPLDLKLTQNISAWSFIKARRTDHCGVPPLNHDGSVHSDSVAKSNIFNSYFNSVYTKELFHNMPTLIMMESDYPDMPEIEITLDGVVSLLQKLKLFKACGPDKFLIVF